MKVVVCNTLKTPLGEHYEVWIDGQDVEDPKWDEFTDKVLAKQYATDLANREGLEVVYP